MAYGDNRQTDVSDTFDTEIDGNWDRGPGDWEDYVWATGGFVNAASNDQSGANSYTGRTHADDQWCKVTVNAQDGGSYLSANARHVGGAAEAMYSATAAEAEDEYQIYEFEEGIGGGIIAGATASPGGELPFGAGDYVVIECEGTRISLGSNAGGADAEKIETSDGTLTEGDIGLGGYEGGDETATDITAFEGGDIAAGGNLEVTATLATLDIAKEDSAVNATLEVAATLATLTIAKQDAVITYPRNITATLATLDMAAVNATMNMSREVVATLATLDIAKEDATVDTSSDLNVSATLATLDIAAVNASANATRNITATLATLTLSDEDAVITLPRNITATLATLDIAAANATMNMGRNVDATLATLTYADLDAVVSSSIHRNITATLATLTMLGYSTSMNATRNITATLATLDIAKEDATVVRARNIVATKAALSIVAHNTLINGVGAVLIQARRSLLTMIGRRR